MFRAHFGARRGLAQMDLSSWKVVYFLTLISASDHLISRKISHGNLSFYQPNPDTKLSKPQFGVHGHTSNPCDREGSMIGQLAPGAHIHWPTLVRRTNASRHGAPPLPSPLRAPMHGEPALSRRSLRCGARDLSGVRRLFPCQQSMLSV